MELMYEMSVNRIFEITEWTGMLLLHLLFLYQMDYEIYQIETGQLMQLQE
jgi:hypothetical protein